MNMNRQTNRRASFWHLLVLLLTINAVSVQATDYQTTFADEKDSPPSNTGPVGLPTWSVSQPYINLWVQYPAIRYRTSAGIAVVLDIVHRSGGPTPSGFGFGPGWNCSWLSTVSYTAEWDNELGIWLLPYSPVLDAPLGGIRVYTADGNTPEYSTYSHLSQVGTFNPGCGIGYEVTYPDHSKAHYAYNICRRCAQGSNPCDKENYISWFQDPQGRQLTFYYTTNSSGAVLLQYAVDHDGLTNRLYYDANFPTQISQAVDPYGRTNRFYYNGTGQLTNIVNPEQISSFLVYDQAGVITNLVTPFGTNVFVYTSNTNAGNIVKRSILVTEADGRKHLFMYRDQSSKLNASSSADLVPCSYPAGEVPSTGPFTNAFDNTWMDARNSFYWSPRCYLQLSTNFLQTGSFDSLTTNDYKLAHLRHWLFTGGSSLPRVGGTLSMERLPSPDGVQEGQKLWYDYWGKPGQAGTNCSGAAVTNYFSEGTGIASKVSAWLTPDGASGFSFNQYDSYGRVVLNVSTYESGSGIGLRTNNFVYSDTGDLIYASGPSGSMVVSNLWNSDHQLLKTCNALNEATVFTYDNSKRLTSVKIPGGLVVTNYYYATGLYAGWLEKTVVLDPLWATNSFSYTNGLVFTATNALGGATTNVYDRLGRLTGTFDGRGSVSYNFAGLVLSNVIDRMGFTNAYGYDRGGRVTAETNALGRYTLYAYTPSGSLDWVRDAEGGYSFFSYDNLARNIRTVGPDNFTQEVRYDRMGRATNLVDSAGGNVTNWFNHQGLLVASSNCLGRLFAALYDVEDRATNQTDLNNVTSSVTYDALDRVLTRVFPDGGTEKFAYSSLGLVAYTNPLTKVASFGYDKAGRPTFETNANGEITQSLYDVSGNLTNLVDAKLQRTSWSFDVFGRLTSKIDHLGTNVLSCAYDANDRLTNRATPAKGSIVYRYDAVGNLTNIDYPCRADVRLMYDSLNRLTNEVTVGLFTNRYTYAPSGLLLSEDGPWASDTTSYTYNQRLCTATSLSQPNSSPWVEQYGYDSALRLTNLISASGTFGYSFGGADAAVCGSLIRRITLPNGSYVTNAFDSCGRLIKTALRTSAGLEVCGSAYSLDVGGRRTRETRADGSYVDYGYDAINRLQSATGWETNGSVVRPHERLGYAYDAMGNLVFRTNNALIQAFTLNGLNQVTGASRSGTLTVAGMTSSLATNVTVNGGSAALYGDRTFAREGMALADGTNTFTAIARDSYGRLDTNVAAAVLPATVSYAYDLNGNLTNDGRRVFFYDEENQLVCVLSSNSWKSEFLYDGRNLRRVAKEYAWESGGWLLKSERRYIYNGNLVLQERDASNLPLVTYTRGLDLSGTFEGAGGIGGLLARKDAAPPEPQLATAFYYSDGRGNVACLLDSNQIVVAAYLYDPYGNLLGQAGPLASANAYRFSSKEVHARSGLVCFGLRYYDPALQRWISRDPLQEDGGINLYQFAAASPVGLLDPWGAQPVLQYPNGGGNVARDTAARMDGFGTIYVDGGYGYVDAWRETKTREPGDPNNGVPQGPGQPARLPSSTVTLDHIRVCIGPIDKVLGGGNRGGSANVGEWKGIGSDPTPLYRAISDYLAPLAPGQKLIEDAVSLYATPGGEVFAPVVGGGIKLVGKVVSPTVEKVLESGACNRALFEAYKDSLRAAEAAQVKAAASQAQMAERGTIMAGTGGRVPFRDAPRVAAQYGGKASDWVKKTSSAFTAENGTKFEVHWVENIVTGQRVEFKTKFP
jgi:RHS repeat-associated protein